MRRVLGFTSLLSVAAVLGGARSASAQPRPALDWNATPACSSGPEVLDDVTRILSGSPASERTVAARVRVDGTDSGAWKVAMSIETASGTGRRSFDAESCAAAASAVAFILALAVNPAIGTNGAQPAASDAAPPPGPYAPPPPVATLEPSRVDSPESREPSTRSSLPRPDPPERSFPEVLVLVAGATDLGTLPRATPGVAGAIGLQAGRWHFEGAGGYWTPQSATATTSAAGAQFRAFSVDGRAAYGWPFGPFAAGPFAGAGVESLAASGFGGTSANYARGAAVGTILAGAFGSWRAQGGAGLRLEVEGEVPLSRLSFSVDEPPPRAESLVFRLPPVAGRALLGVEARF